MEIMGSNKLMKEICPCCSGYGVVDPGDLICQMALGDLPFLRPLEAPAPET